MSGVAKASLGWAAFSGGEPWVGFVGYAHPGVFRTACSQTRAGAIADQVCLDIPPRLWDVEVEFWRAFTGRPLEPGGRPEFGFLGDPDPSGPPRILLQRLDDDAPRVMAHLDFAVRDRQAQIRHHESISARRIDDFERWTQMRAPSGHVYCLTDRDPGTGRIR